MKIIACYLSDPDDGVGEITLDLPAVPRVGDLVSFDEEASRFFQVDEVRWHDDYVWIYGEERTE